MQEAPIGVVRRSARFIVGTPSPEPMLTRPDGGAHQARDVLLEEGPSRSGSTTPKARPQGDAGLLAPKPIYRTHDTVAGCIEKIRALRDNDGCKEALSLINEARSSHANSGSIDVTWTVEQALCEQKRGNYRLACEQYQVALEHMVVLGLPRIGSVKFKLATCKHVWQNVGGHGKPSRDEVVEAFKVARDALEQDAKNCDMPPINYGINEHRIGLCAEHNNDFDSALYHYNRALSVFRECGSAEQKAFTLHRTAVVANRIRDYRLADWALMQARDAYRAARMSEQVLGLETEVGVVPRVDNLLGLEGMHASPFA